MVDQLPDSTPGQVSGGDLAEVERTTQKIVQERGAFRADQFQLESAFRAHWLHTGPEIWIQSSGAIDGFCDFVGTGGTFAGCAAAFKERNANIQCFVVEPQGAAVLAGKEAVNPSHRIQGGGYAMTNLTFLNHEHIDGYLQVTDDEAMQGARRLAREEGIFGGFSGGANLAAAVQLLQGPLDGKTIVIMICDSGLKYLSTDLWE